MQLRKARLLGCVAVVVIALIAVAGPILLFAIRPDTRPRSGYRSYDSSTDRRLLSFDQEYEHARENADSWTENPIDVALRIAGYPNPDSIEPDRVCAFYRNPSSVTVIVTKAGLMDDSVEAEETRVDLVTSDGIWEIDWVGARYRCQRTLYRGWVTSLCP
jgi:hypothetical protein